MIFQGDLGRFFVGDPCLSVHGNTWSFYFASCIVPQSVLLVRSRHGLPWSCVHTVQTLDTHRWRPLASAVAVREREAARSARSRLAEDPPRKSDWIAKTVRLKHFYCNDVFYLIPVCSNSENITFFCFLDRQTQNDCSLLKRIWAKFWTLLMNR